MSRELAATEKGGDERFDGLERRCPRLGGSVSFAYCRTIGYGGGDEGGKGRGEGEISCCFKILDCWWERFDVADYLRSRYSEAAVEKLHGAKPKPKVETLLDLIQQAKTRAGS